MMVLGCVILLIANIYIINKYIKKTKYINSVENKLKKTTVYYKMLNIWFSQEQRGKTLIPYMRKKEYERVAIYGMAELGERLYYELINGGIEVVCVIDKSPYIMGEFDFKCVDDDIPDVDVIIVTAEYYFSEIKKLLSRKTEAEIIGLSALIGNAFKMNW